MGNLEPKWTPDLDAYVRRAARTWGHRLKIRGEDIADVEQDAAITAWLRVENGKIRYREALWFIARNAALEFRNRNARHDAASLDETLLATPRSPDARLVLESVEAEFPELVMLAAARDSGYSWDQIAAQLDIPCGNLRVRYSRLVKKATKHFGEAVWDLLQIERC